MVRILFLADSHLGFDLPSRPRVTRRRRGHDFLANYAHALDPAFRGDVDMVVHGGDVFHRSRVPRTLAWQAYEPLNRLAERMPVFVVPGNHERGRLPHPSVLSSRVRVFERPRTFVIEVRGMRIALAGFPYERGNARGGFAGLVRSTGWRAGWADMSLLCMHHCVEGATVGPGDFTFRSGDEVIRCRDIPAFDGVFSGHIHRHQVLTTDLRGDALTAPVLYPGSIERTAFAEMGEEKGYLRVDADGGGLGWRFERLPARPMHVLPLDPAGWCEAAIEAAVRRFVAGLPADAVLRIRLSGPSEPAWRALSASRLRAMLPPTMNADVTPRPPAGRAARRQAQMRLL